MLQYCEWLCNRFTLVFILLFMCIYWIISLKGMLAVEPRITPKKLFLSDSIINDVSFSLLIFYRGFKNEANIFLDPHVCLKRKRLHKENNFLLYLCQTL
jgi:hypothetical protein